MFLPTPVYQTLPVLYLGGGLLSASAVGGGRGLAAGILLALAGGWVARMRLHARRGPPH